MGPIRCAETSVGNYRLILRDRSEDAILVYTVAAAWHNVLFNRLK
jgi:hypothetical protein